MQIERGEDEGVDGMRAFSWSAMWQPTWPPWEVALRAAILYCFVQLVFRLVGRKELGRYSTSDIVVLFLFTVAVRKAIVGDDSSLTNAFVGLATIVGLDWLLRIVTFRSRRAANVLEGPVRQIIRGGELVEEELARNRISRDQLLALLRLRGHASLEEVRDAFLERSGRISFILFDQSQARR